MDVNDQIIELFETKIDSHYQNAKQLLLRKINFSAIDKNLIDLSNIEDYFSFMESKLKRPFNRFAAMHQFISDNNKVLINPLVKLKPEIKMQIDELYLKTCKLTQGLGVSEIDPEFKTIQGE